MGILDKTRKILWGRSGAHCALCRRELVIDATEEDDESVVGDECHIISGRKEGPRYDERVPFENLDQLDNLILLCRVHHKMVDDQSETYTVELLKSLKRNHEKWVVECLSKSGDIPPVRIRRYTNQIPRHLIRITSGRDLFKILDNAYAYICEHDDITVEAEVELISEFCQNVQDWGDLSSDLDAGDKVRAACHLDFMLKELEEHGFWTFGGQEKAMVEGGKDMPQPFPIVHIWILRSTNPTIIKTT